MNFLIRFFSPLFFIISVFFWIYVYYKSEIYWGGSLNRIYNFYHFFSFLLVLCSLLSFFLNKTTKDYLIISIFTIIFTFYSFEIYLSLNEKNSNMKKEKEAIYKKNDKKFDTRSSVEIYNKLNQKEKRVSLPLAPLINFYPNYSIMPLSGMSNSKTVFCNESGYYSIYQSDRYGFNNPDKEWDSKEIEYLLVGDSFTHGACVNRPDDIASVLRNISNKPALNLGWSANGPLIQFATLKEYLLPSVDKVIWVFYEGNDFDDLKNEMKNKKLDRYYKDFNYKQNLLLKQKEIDELVKTKINEAVDPKNTIKSFIFLRNFRNFLTTHLSLKNQNNFETNPKKIDLSTDFVNILKYTKKLVNKNNSELYFVFIPTDLGVGLTKDDTLYKMIEKKVRELDINFIDIKSVLENEEDVKKFIPLGGGHFNSKGYQKIAETIYDLTKK